MGSLSDVSVEDFEKSLTAQRLLTLILIQFAMAGGVLIFGAVVLFTRLSKDPGLGGTGLDMMTTVNLIFAAMMTCLSFVVPKLAFSDNLIARHIRAMGLTGANTPADACFMAIQQATLIRLAMLEGAALFSMVVLFLGKSWLNLLGVLPVLIFAFGFIPNRSRVMKIFILKIKKEPRLLIEHGL